MYARTRINVLMQTRLCAFMKTFSSAHLCCYNRFLSLVGGEQWKGRGEQLTDKQITRFDDRHDKHNFLYPEFGSKVPERRTIIFKGIRNCF